MMFFKFIRFDIKNGILRQYNAVLLTFLFSFLAAGLHALSLRVYELVHPEYLDIQSTIADFMITVFAGCRENAAQEMTWPNRLAKRPQRGWCLCLPSNLSVNFLLLLVLFPFAQSLHSFFVGSWYSFPLAFGVCLRCKPKQRRHDRKERQWRPKA